MKTLTIVRTVVLGAVISIAAVSNASAQHKCNVPGHGKGRKEQKEKLMDQRLDRLKLLLELTPDQEAQVKALAQKHAKEAEAECAKMREEHQKQMNAHKAEMRTILTDKQYAKFEALQVVHSKGAGKCKNGRYERR